MKNIKSSLQNVGENLAYQTKCYFKSHDLAIFIQILLLSIPITLSLYSFYLGWSKCLDYISFWFSVLSLVYYMYFGKNTELYKIWWEKYLILYKKAENYFKNNSNYKKTEIDKLLKLQNNLAQDSNKPSIHVLSKWWTDKVLEKEMKYANEKHVWWRLK